MFCAALVVYAVQSRAISLCNRNDGDAEGDIYRHWLR